MISSVRSCLRAEAETIDPRPGMAVVSLCGMNDGAVALHAGWLDTLTVRFEGLQFDETAGPAALGGWETYVSRGGFADTHARVISRWIDGLARRPQQVDVVVNCRDGESGRAVARFIALRHRVLFDLEDARYNRTVFCVLQQPDRWKPQAGIACRLPFVRHLANLFA